MRAPNRKEPQENSRRASSPVARRTRWTSTFSRLTLCVCQLSPSSGSNRKTELDAASRRRRSAAVLAKKSKTGEDGKTALTLWIPSPPCWWPVYQYAHVSVAGDTSGSGGLQRGRVLFDSTVRVSVRWFPLLVTFIVVGFIYPGCAMIAWRAERRRAHRELSGKTILDVLKTRTL